MTDWAGAQVIQGFADDLLDRLPKDASPARRADDWGSQDAANGRVLAGAHRRVPRHRHLVADDRSGAAEARLPGDGARERRAAWCCHAWAALPIVEDGSGQRRDLREQGRPPGDPRQAWWSTAPATATCSPAPAPRSTPTSRKRDIHHCMNTAWSVRRRRHGPLDRLQDRPARRALPRSWTAGARSAAASSRRPFVSWRNDVALFMGPRQSGYSALDVDDLTEVEIRSHRLMAQHLEFFRDARAGVRGRVPDAVARRSSACATRGGWPAWRG